MGHEDSGKPVSLPSGGRLALFSHSGRIYALEDRCCHKQKTIHSGDIEDLGECVVSEDGELGVGGVCVQCPRHQKKFGGGLYFNLDTGQACVPELTKAFRKLDSHRIMVYNVMVESGNVYVSAHSQKPSGGKRQKTDQVVHQASECARISKMGEVPTQAEDLQHNPRLASLSAHCTLEKVTRINHNTLLFYLRHSKSEVLPLPPGSPIWHVTLSALINGKSVERDYTPLSDWPEWREQGRIRLLVKIYADGAMTQHLAAQVPSLLPLTSACDSGMPSHILLFAAGSGVIPMLQIIREVLHARGEARTVTLLCSNRTYGDLLCWDELCSLQTHASLPVFRAWLIFSSGAANCMGLAPVGWPLERVVHHRIDRALVCEALAPLKLRQGPDQLRVIVSGTEGFFEAMSDTIPATVREPATFVNLDD